MGHNKDMSHITIQSQPIFSTVETRVGKFDLHIQESTQEKGEFDNLKEFGKEIYKSAGYSEYETVNLDKWSTWFHVSYEGYIQASTRVVRKVLENKIPLEIAQRASNDSHYEVKNLNTADWNSVTFLTTILGAQAFKIAARAVAKYCLDKKFDIVYGMVNPVWEGLNRVYLQYGAEYSKEFSDPVYFPGCFLNGKRALFQLLEIKENALQKIAANL